MALPTPGNPAGTHPFIIEEEDEDGHHSEDEDVETQAAQQKPSSADRQSRPDLPEVPLTGAGGELLGPVPDQSSADTSSTRSATTTVVESSESAPATMAERTGSAATGPHGSRPGPTPQSATRVPAAGAGTRTGPRPVPRSSSSLRHIASSRAQSSRGVSFHTVPEDSTADAAPISQSSDTGSLVRRRIDAEHRKRRESFQQLQGIWADESEEDNEIRDANSDAESSAYSSERFRTSRKVYADLSTDDDSDEKLSSAAGERQRRGQGVTQRMTSKKSSDGPYGLGPAGSRDNKDSSGDDEVPGGQHRDQRRTTSAREIATSLPSYSEAGRSPKDGSKGLGEFNAQGVHTGYAKGAISGTSTGKHRSEAARTRLHSGRKTATSEPTVPQTPGLVYPASLNTPPEGSTAASTPEIEPRQRLEWQTMLESVLASEVLRSETKRITSVDTPDLSRQELLYRRWLDIRASLRGRGHFRGAVEAEEKRLKAGWSELLHSVIDATKACRADAEQLFESEAAIETVSADVSEMRRCAFLMSESSEQETQEIYEEVGHLLQRVDDAESQFPSTRKAVEVVPAWGDAVFQARLEALYAWHNTTSLLNLQLQILREWTGSESLAIDVPLQTQASTAHSEVGPLKIVPNGELEGMTFVERILKQESLKSTFEKRTLGSLNKLVCKARDTLKTYHTAFAKMQLPSFAPQLTELISFPMRLTEGAVRMRLDYAGKIKEPSLLIIDSLTDDLREALDIAIRTKRTYLAIMVPDVEHGWQLAPVIETSYDEILREALRFFFRLISFKLKGSVFFKETEILDTEWQFLSQAVEVIEGGDIIVAKSITKIVNKLFTRIIGYFKSELATPSAARRIGGADEGTGDLPVRQADGGPDEANKTPSFANASASTAASRGFAHLSVPEKVKWIHGIFDNVRVRSRKLLGFARDIRNRLDNAAEYDLASLRPPISPEEQEASTADSRKDSNASLTAEGMDLNAFLQTLINADYFLVYTQTYEERGIYIIAEPSLHDKPEIIQDLISKCVRRISPHTSSYASGGVKQMNVATGADEEHPGIPEDGDAAGAQASAPAPAGFSIDENEPPHYLLLLTPRDPFMWTGKVMPHTIDRIEVDLDERRLRLIADGPKDRLQLCKDHFYRVFTSDAVPDRLWEGRRATHPRDETSGHDAAGAVGSAAPAGFPLDVINEHMAHMSDVQAELSDINKGVYMLSTTIIRAVPRIRRSMKAASSRISASKSPHKHQHGDGDKDGRVGKSATESEELIQNCFSMAAEQGFRALPFIESVRLRGFMTLSLARLSIDWVGFICDDCVPTDRKTFKWAVAALENAVQVTRDENIFHLSEEDFNLMRAKVASCVALLISHFDILGARSSVAKAKEEQERLEREKAERSRAVERNAVTEGGEEDEDHLDTAVRLVQDLGPGGAGAPPMLNRTDSGMQATEERWVQKMIEWDEARQHIEAEQRLIGRVLDDTRLEDQGLQFLASSNSRVHIRWQQGRFIGGGTFGTVYLAVNLDSGGLMAVKEIRFQDISSTPTLYKQIKDEMNVMEMLSHPNIVEYYGIEVHRDKVYIFEEYCQGGSLAQLLEHGRIEDEAVIQVYTLQMLDGLVYLHSQNVVHRDIKPDNILLDHMGVIKFVDFGAAKVLAKNSRTVQRSRRAAAGGGMVNNNAMAGMVGPDGKPVGAAAVQSLQGTPMYMSPEVIKGETRGRRGAMDVWSLGCVVLEFATGRRPWSQLDNEWAIMFHIGMAQQHPPLPEPGQLSELGIDFIRQCLIIDPYDRPSAMEMRQHPWIQNLVEQLDEQAEEEATLAASTVDNGGGAITPGLASDFGHSSTSTSLSTGHTTGRYANFAATENRDGASSTGYRHSSDSTAGIAAMVATPGTRSINGFNFQRPNGGSIRSLAAGSDSVQSWRKSLKSRSASTVESNSDAPSTAGTSEGDQVSSSYKVAPSLQEAVEAGPADTVHVPPPVDQSSVAGHDGSTELHDRLSRLPSEPAQGQSTVLHGHDHGHDLGLVGLPHHHAHGAFPAQVADLAWREEEKMLENMRIPLEQSGCSHPEYFSQHQQPSQAQTREPGSVVEETSGVDEGQ
ncbi:unnamed protein product [Parajaminaea phylloscopi]